MSKTHETSNSDPSRRARTLPLVGASAALAIAATLVGFSSGQIANADSTATNTAASTASDTSAPAPTRGSSRVDIVALAEAFAATLTEEQQALLYQDYTFENATNWSNLPSGGGPGGTRVGITLGDLTDEQFTAFETLLAAVTGCAPDEGFDEIVQHLAADDYLATIDGDVYGTENFSVAFLGTPSDSGTWELQFGGHHLAFANTYTDGALAGATPAFRGIEPMTTVEQDEVTIMAEQQEQAAFAAFIASLTTEQQAAATTTDVYTDILLGPEDDWAFPTTPEGIKGSDLTDGQKKLLLAAINTYVGDLSRADATSILKKYESELDETYFLFSGTTSVEEEEDYVRVDGPSVWIEFSMQEGVVVDGAHPHAVWRDKVTDYGGLTS